ncbi:PhnA domain-containing protein [Cellulophaga sp. 20_2_10]|uniref:PhnA domain-containing protein n=1 Tax=Cellulophaga sp. 20_2_10 TaxID=2942476 RepID=UPI00201A8D0A|nr:alkylphosphonate utilization protein [Cellulophaga sp. 20_2_10]MCL5244771.1 PhnA domain-containing protein [Cellulophaga sp. 20_2_10]
MSIERELSKRSQNKCELCSNEENLAPYAVLPAKNGDLQDTIFACATCITQIEDPEQTDPNHWRCLNDSMWSEQIPVQIIAWRMLSRLRKEGWPQDLLDMMYLDDDNLEWAKATNEGEADEDKIIHRDSNGVIINAGDSVVLIKDLPVKGSSMIAKRGTAVRRVSLDHENAEYIEGKVDGQQVVIITKYVKKL